MIPIASGYTPQTTSHQVGITADEGPPPPNGSCAWYGYHVHQEQVSGGTWAKLNYPDENTCNEPNVMTDCATYDINAYAMLRLTWSQ